MDSAAGFFERDGARNGFGYEVVPHDGVAPSRTDSK
jgi:hypothetical protein